jgi:hypothetical protein
VAVPTRPGVPLAGVDTTVECLVLSDMVIVYVFVSDLKLYKSRLPEDAFQSAPGRAKPGPTSSAVSSRHCRSFLCLHLLNSTAFSSSNRYCFGY